MYLPNIFFPAILKRVIDDYGHHMASEQIEALRNTTWLAEQHVWLFTYQKKMFADNNLEFKSKYNFIIQYALILSFL